MFEQPKYQDEDPEEDEVLIQGDNGKSTGIRLLVKQQRSEANSLKKTKERVMLSVVSLVNMTEE